MGSNSQAHGQTRMRIQKSLQESLNKLIDSRARLSAENQGTGNETETRRNLACVIDSLRKEAGRSELKNARSQTSLAQITITC